MCSNCSCGDYENPDMTAFAEEPTQVERLGHSKFSVLTAEERSEQLVKSAAASFYHVHLAQKIAIHIGDGDPLDMLLQDAFYRQKFNLKARQL